MGLRLDRRRRFIADGGQGLENGLTQPELVKAGHRGFGHGLGVSGEGGAHCAKKRARRHGFLGSCGGQRVLGRCGGRSLAPCAASCRPSGRIGVFLLFKKLVGVLLAPASIVLFLAVAAAIARKLRRPRLGVMAHRLEPGGAVSQLDLTGERRAAGSFGTRLPASQRDATSGRRNAHRGSRLWLRSRCEAAHHRCFERGSGRSRRGRRALVPGARTTATRGVRRARNGSCAIGAGLRHVGARPRRLAGFHGRSRSTERYRAGGAGHS